MAPVPNPSPDPQQPQPAPAQQRLLAQSPSQAFWYGLIKTLPFLLVIIPFGLLFGLVATEAGMDLAQVMGFSVLVLAGASQFTAVQLLSDNAPAILVIISALAVNLRMAMYSASLVPWLGKAPMRDKMLISYLLLDQSYAMSVQHYEANPRLSLRQRLAYFYGAAVMLCLPWAIATWLGATVGRAIPDDFALDFAVPITFLAMIAPMLRTAAHMAACAVAIVAALLLAWMPSGLGLLIAAPLGMATGALVETMIEKRRAVQ